MYYTVSTLWGSRTNKSLGTYNIVLLALNYQMYNIAKHTYITSFWAVHHSTSMRNHAHIKWNTLLETTITSLIHFSGIPREFSKAIDVTLCSGDTRLCQNTHGKAKSLICCWGVPKKYCSNTFTIPKFSQVAMISLQVSDFSLLDIKACTNDLCKGY